MQRPTSFLPPRPPILVQPLPLGGGGSRKLCVALRGGGGGQQDQPSSRSTFASALGWEAGATEGGESLLTPPAWLRSLSGQRMVGGACPSLLTREKRYRGGSLHMLRCTAAQSELLTQQAAAAHFARKGARRWESLLCLWRAQLRDVGGQDPFCCRVQPPGRTPCLRAPGSREGPDAAAASYTGVGSGSPPGLLSPQMPASQLPPSLHSASLSMSSLPSRPAPHFFHLHV